MRVSRCKPKSSHCTENRFELNEGELIKSAVNPIQKRGHLHCVSVVINTTSVTGAQMLESARIHRVSGTDNGYFREQLNFARERDPKFNMGGARSDISVPGTCIAARRLAPAGIRWLRGLLALPNGL